jgi:hypothetical protein
MTFTLDAADDSEVSKYGAYMKTIHVKNSDVSYAEYVIDLDKDMLLDFILATGEDCIISASDYDNIDGCITIYNACME